MSRAIQEYLLKKFEKKVDDVLVFRGMLNKEQLKFANNKLSVIKDWSSENLSVFVAKDKKVVMSSLKKFDKASANEFVSTVLKFVKKSEVNENYNGIYQGKDKYSKIKDLFDPSVECADCSRVVKECIDKGEELGVKKLAGVFESSVSEEQVIGSNGIDLSSKDSSLYLSCKSIMDKYSTGHVNRVSRVRNKFDYLSAVEESAEHAKLMVGKKKLVSGKHDVIFHPMAFAGFLEAYGDSASMFTVESGLSFLHDKKGKEVANSKVTLWDDATIPNGLGSTSYDQEGHPTKKNLIVGRGVMRDFLYNTSYAKKYDTESTGNAGLISPDAHNLYLDPGKVSKEKMFDGFNGLYIANVWYTRFQNYNTGEFSTIPRDGVFLVKDGEFTPLKEIRVTENMINLMKNVNTIGSDLQQIYSWEVATPVFTPHVKVNDVNITKPQ
jgi:PmbA protein